MKTESINCNNCGAVLEVPQAANFVTCNYCESHLAVRRTDSVVFTELLEQIGDRQEEMLERLDRMERSSEIADLDRQWKEEKRQYMVPGENGQMYEPSLAGPFMAVVVAVFGVLWTVYAATNFPGMAIFGVVFVFVAVVIAIGRMRNDRDYRQAHQRYRRRRRMLTKGQSRRI